MDNEAYYINGYDIEDDPYVYDNGVLINKFDIKDTKTLNEIEAMYTSISMQEIINSDFSLNYEVSDLNKIHNQLFHDVYPWAGEFRKVDIAKGSSFFLENREIESNLKNLFDQLNKNKSDIKNKEDFSKYFGELLSTLNQIHPFREGNGRTQRIFITYCAKDVGLEMNWKAISNDAMKNACIEGSNSNYRPMQKLLNLNLEYDLVNHEKLKQHLSPVQEKAFRVIQDHINQTFKNHPDQLTKKLEALYAKLPDILENKYQIPELDKDKGR